MDRPKALLVYPPTGLFDRTDRCQTPIAYTSAQGLRMPLDLAYMAASLQVAGVTCRIADYPARGEDWTALQADIISWRPDYLFLSITTFSFIDDMEACRRAKEIHPTIKTVAKGAHFLLHARQLLERHPELDVAIRGESELAAGELVTRPWNEVRGLTYRSNGVILDTEDRPPLLELDQLPIPAHDLIEHHLYRLPPTDRPFATVLAGRGCPYRCIFCIVTDVSGKRVRMRSPEHLADELERCSVDHGVDDFLFKADSFTTDRQWVHDLCAEIRRRDLGIRWMANSRPDDLDVELARALRSAGCWMLAIGVESGSPESLRRMRKAADTDDARRAINACRRADIQSFAYFTIGFPWETPAHIRQTIEHAIDLDPDYAEFHPCFPLPGTELYEMALNEGLLGAWSPGKGVMPSNFLRPREMTLRQLNRLRIEALVRFYGRPSYLARTLARFSRGGQLARVGLHALRSSLTIARYTVDRSGW